MGILRAMAIRRRVKEMQEYARVLSVATAELRYRRDILAQIFVRVAKKMPPAICRVAVRAFTGTHGGAAETGIFLYGSGCRF